MKNVIKLSGRKQSSSIWLVCPPAGDEKSELWPLTTPRSPGHGNLNTETLFTLIADEKI